jgi:hypothetical protein
MSDQGRTGATPFRYSQIGHKLRPHFRAKGIGCACRQELSEQAAEEQDPKRLLELVTEINRLLAEREAQKNEKKCGCNRLGGTQCPTTQAKVLHRRSFVPDSVSRRRTRPYCALRSGIADFRFDPKRDGEVDLELRSSSVRCTVYTARAERVSPTCTAASVNV